MGEQLGMVVRAAETFDPVGGLRVSIATRGARDLAVRDVTYEHVPKRVLVLASDRGAPLAANQPLPLEDMQSLLDRPEIETRELGRRTGPEDLAEHGGVLYETLLRPSRRAATIP